MALKPNGTPKNIHLMENIIFMCLNTMGNERICRNYREQKKGLMGGSGDGQLEMSFSIRKSHNPIFCASDTCLAKKA